MRAAEILSETVIGDRFHIVVADAPAAIAASPRRLSEGGVRCGDAVQIAPSLEDVFVSDDRGAARARPAATARG